MASVKVRPVLRYQVAVYYAPTAQGLFSVKLIAAGNPRRNAAQMEITPCRRGRRMRESEKLVQQEYQRSALRVKEGLRAVKFSFEKAGSLLPAFSGDLEAPNSWQVRWADEMPNRRLFAV